MKSTQSEVGRRLAAVYRSEGTESLRAKLGDLARRPLLSAVFERLLEDDDSSTVASDAARAEALLRSTGDVRPTRDR